MLQQSFPLIPMPVSSAVLRILLRQCFRIIHDRADAGVNDQSGSDQYDENDDNVIFIVEKSLICS